MNEEKYDVSNIYVTTNKYFIIALTISLLLFIQILYYTFCMLIGFRWSLINEYLSLKHVSHKKIDIKQITMSTTW